MNTTNGLDYLDYASCIEAYSVEFLTGRRNLLMVTNSTTLLYSNNTRAIEGTVFGELEFPSDISYGFEVPLGWISGELNNNYSPLTIEYCLSQITPGLCYLSLVIYIMIIVISCNTIKVASIVCSFWILTDESLVVIGDTLSSSLEALDINTKGCCLMEARGDLSICYSQGNIWRFKRHRWFYAATPFSVARCFICFV
jgi:hypothetical protein